MINLKSEIKSKDSSLGTLIGETILREGIKQAGEPVFKVINGVLYRIVDNTVPSFLIKNYK